MVSFRFVSFRFVSRALDRARRVARAFARPRGLDALAAPSRPPRARHCGARARAASTRIQKRAGRAEIDRSDARRSRSDARRARSPRGDDHHTRDVSNAMCATRAASR